MLSLSIKELRVIDDNWVQLINDDEQKIIEGLINNGLVVIKELDEQDYFFLITLKAELIVNGEARA